MINFIRNLRLNVKIAILGVGSVVITALALVGLAVWQSGQYNTLAQKDVNDLINADLDHITQGVYNLVKTEDQAVQQQVDNNLNVAQHVLDRNGGISLSGETISWLATNQFTDKTNQIILPKMLVGSEWLGKNTDRSIETAVVDEIETLIGETATIFQIMNDDGDMLRVATTVTNAAGQRAIGTYIPAVNPDGTPNPVIETVKNGETYHGRAYVVDDWYLTAYKPFYDTSGNLIGMLYVGVRLQSLESRVRQAIIDTKVGQTGYVYVLRGTGEERGYYIISKDGLRDGENIWESKDYHGNYFIQELISKAIVLGPGEMDTIRYPWQNLDEDEPRWKVARIAYYEPWDWVIGTSAYEDELQIYRTVLSQGRSRMTSIMGFAGLIISLLVGLAGLYVAWSIAHPIQKMTRVVETINQGNLDQVVDIGSKDEIGVLARAFNQMTASQRDTLNALKRSEERFRSLIENSSDLICVLNMQGIITYESPSVKRILGYNPEQRIGLSIYEYIYDPDLPQIKEIIGEISNKKNISMRFEGRFKHQDGTVRIFDIACKNSLSDPSIKGIILNSRDITQRKLSEDELYRTNSLMTKVFDNIPVTIFLKEVERLSYVKFNQAGLDLIGLSLEDFLGKTDFEIFPPDQAQALAEEDREILQQEEVIDIPEQPIQTRDKGLRIVHAKKVRLVDPNGNPEYLLGLAEDITERIKVEKELNKHRAHLEEEVAERTQQLTTINQELETFNYSVSHDLRAHIRAINAYGQFIIDDAGNKLNDNEKRYLGNILSESRRMQELIEDLIKLSHVSHTPINTEKIDLSALVEKIISNLEQSHPERNVVTTIQKGMTIKADIGLLTVALENLIGNAWKFTAHEEVGKIEFGTIKKDGEKVFFIRDNGAGFDMKFTDKLFLPFQRFHSAQEFPGTGIGLSTVHRIIQRHGGKIWAESQPGISTTFFFSM